MKPFSKISLLTSHILLLCIAAHAQTIRRVNNNPGVTGVNVYTTAQAAHDAAVANDILIIEPSVTNYGGLTLNKPLKVYGNGYFLDLNIELKADQRRSFLSTVDINVGGGGSSFFGIEATSFVIWGSSNVTIGRCRITDDRIRLYNRNAINTTNTNVSNIVITQSYLRIPNSYPSVEITGTGGFTISNVMVTNNHMNHLLAGDNAVIQNWIVRNNTMFIGTATTLVNSVFENNIMGAGGTVSFANVTFSYNISSQNTFSGGIGNQNNFDLAPEWLGGDSNDEFHRIKTGSPLKTAGSGGIEVGAYGGATPYVVSGIPAIPSIVNMNNTATGSNATPLSVTISVKSNN
jgi:hypothetical protein